MLIDGDGNWKMLSRTSTVFKIENCFQNFTKTHRCSLSKTKFLNLLYLASFTNLLALSAIPAILDVPRGIEKNVWRNTYISPTRNDFTIIGREKNPYVLK